MLSLLTALLRRAPFPSTRTEDGLDRFPAPKEQPRKEKDHHKVESAIRPKNTIVLPLVLIEDVETSSELVTIGILAEFAKPIGAILYVAACLLDEGLSVGLTCLAWRWSETGKFVGSADDGTAVRGDRKEAFKEVTEWGKVVHP